MNLQKYETLKKMFEQDKSQIKYAIFRNISKVGLLNHLSDELYLKIAFRLSMNKKLNLNNPKTFNEKIQWLKLYDRKDEYITLVDKYRVREYIKKVIGEKYLIPMLGVWNNADEIDFEKLPEKFVLKCNHDSGSVIICENKNQLDIKKVKEKLNKSLRKNGYYFGREWPYKNVEPCIICEKYMIDDKEGELKDYKFFCFSGQVYCFKIDFDRFVKHRANYYSREKELLYFGEKVCPPDFNVKLNLPTKIDEMISLAEKLSTDYTFVRVDFYEVNEQVYFGELTFYPASGFGLFVSETWDEKLGNLIKIDNDNIIRR